MADRSKRESRRKFLKAVPAAMAGAVGAECWPRRPSRTPDP